MIRKTIICHAVLVFIAALLACSAANLAFGNDLESWVRPSPWTNWPVNQQVCGSPKVMATSAFRLGYKQVGEQPLALLLFHPRTGNFVLIEPNTDKNQLCITGSGNPNLEGSEPPPGLIG